MTVQELKDKTGFPLRLCHDLLGTYEIDHEECDRVCDEMLKEQKLDVTV